MSGALFETDDEPMLISVYAQVGRTLDDLPYTEDFERLYTGMYGPDGRDAGGVSRADVFHRLHNLRKAGKLPRLGRAAGKAPKLEAEQEAALAELVRDAVGKLSLRDRLLYTPAFDAVVEAFNTRTGLSLSHHDAWRVVAKLAK
ncbi:MAG: hypothetical protein AAGE65_13570 [Planctomycetota bacterium]